MEGQAVGVPSPSPGVNVVEWREEMESLCESLRKDTAMLFLWYERVIACGSLAAWAPFPWAS
jgi:hypothetical protein